MPMLPNSKPDDECPCLTIAMGKVMIRNRDLSEKQQSFVQRYYQLTVQTELTEEDVAHLEYIWETASADTLLAEVLELIDTWHPPCLSGEELVSKDKDLRTYLNEHISVLAEERLKKIKGELQELHLEHTHLRLLCPDGSGAIAFNVVENEFILDDEQVCIRCRTARSAHSIFIFHSNEHGVK
jgi:hypothetical protein